MSKSVVEKFKTINFIQRATRNSLLFVLGVFFLQHQQKNSCGGSTVMMFCIGTGLKLGTMWGLVVVLWLWPT